MASGGMKSLAGKVCIVTGASRGIGRGIALQLGEAGATVYITGRTLVVASDVRGSLTDTAKEIEERGGRCIPVQCDHTKDEDIEQLFTRVEKEQDGQLDLLVNNAYSAVQAIFTNLNVPFWEQPADMWDTVNKVGLRNHYICTIYAAKLMVPRKSGVIVNISSIGGLTYLMNIPYGIGKEGCDRMAADCALELRKHNVAMVSLWPGAVKTEHVQNFLSTGAIDSVSQRGVDSRKLFENGESTEFSGKAVVRLATDPNIMKKSGKILLTSDLGREYGFRDVDGRKLVSGRNLKQALMIQPKTAWLGRFTPGFINIPKWMLALAGNKF